MSGQRRRRRGAGATALNLLKQAHNISVTSTVDIPTCQQGDVGVFIAWGVDTASSAPSYISTPSGWSLVGQATRADFGVGDGHAIQVFTKILTDAESGTTLSGQNGSSAEVNLVVVLRGNYPVTSLDDGDFEALMTQNDPPSRTISCAAATRKGVAAFGVHVSRGGEPRSLSFTPAYDTEIDDSGDRFSLCWLVFDDGAAVDITADTNDSGSTNTFVTWFIEAE